MKLKWKRFQHCNGSHAEIGEYRPQVSEYAPGLWKASVWRDHDQVAFKAMLASEKSAQTAARNLLKRFFMSERRRIDKMLARLVTK